METILSSAEAEELKRLIIENPGLPVVFTTKPNDEYDWEYDAEGGEPDEMIDILSVEISKVLADEDMLKWGSIVTNAEQARVLIRAGMPYGLYRKDPEEYMRIFSEKAAELKQKWRRAIVVHMDVSQDEDD